jgi:hypothetical protein
MTKHNNRLKLQSLEPRGLDVMCAQQQQLKLQSPNSKGLGIQNQKAYKS